MMDKSVEMRENENGVQARSQEVVEIIKNSDGGPALELALNRIGESTKKQFTILRDKMSVAAFKALPEMQEDSPLAKSVMEANEKVMELNPRNVTESLLFKIPIASLRRALIRKYIEGFTSQNSQLMNIFDSLARGRDDLLKKMLELQNQYEALVKTDKQLEEDIEVLKLAQAELEKIDLAQLDEVEKAKYDLAVNKIARKIRDLTTMRSAVQQFFVSINQTLQTTSLLSEQIDSIMFVGPTVLQNAIMIHSAISQQKQVAQAAQHVQKSLADAMKANAEMIKGNAQEVAHMYNNPVIAIEDLAKAYEDLRSAVETTRKAMKDSSVKAKEMTESLESLQKEFAPVKSMLDDEAQTQKKIGRIPTNKSHGSGVDEVIADVVDSSFD